MKGFQKKYLRGLAHGMKPTVFVGRKGFTAALVRAAEEALDTHELIKVKFIEFKEKEFKNEMAGRIEKETASELAGMIGHMAIFYRCHKDPQKRKIILPERQADKGGRFF